MKKFGKKLTSLFVGGVLGLSLIAPLGQFNAYAATPANVTEGAVYETAEGELGGDSSDTSFNSEYVKNDEDNLGGGALYDIVGDAPDVAAHINDAIWLKAGETINTSDYEPISGVYPYKRAVKDDYDYDLYTKTGKYKLFRFSLPLEKFIQFKAENISLTNVPEDDFIFLAFEHNSSYNNGEMKWYDESVGTYPTITYPNLGFTGINAGVPVRGKVSFDGQDVTEYEQREFIILIPEGCDMDLTVVETDGTPVYDEYGNLHYFYLGDGIPDLKSFIDTATEIELDKKYTPADFEQIEATAAVEDMWVWNVDMTEKIKGYLVKTSIPKECENLWLRCGSKAYAWYNYGDTFSLGDNSPNAQAYGVGVASVELKPYNKEKDSTDWYIFIPADSIAEDIYITDESPYEPYDPYDPNFVAEPETEANTVAFVNNTLSKDKVNVIIYNDEYEGLIKTAKKVSSNIPDMNIVNLGTSTNEYSRIVKGLEVYKDSYDCASIVFIADANYVKDLLGNEAAASLYDIGFSAEKYSKSYKLTRDTATFDGKLKGATYYLCPLDFSYNAEIAKKVLGTDDQNKVGEMLSTPEKFLEVASRMKEAGYHMTDGFMNNFTVGTSDEAKALKLSLNAGGYDLGNQAWSKDWRDNMGNGKVFGFFTAPWFNPFCMEHNETKYKNCEGPLNEVWGGCYVGIIDKGHNTDDAVKVLEETTCNETVLSKWADSSIANFVNNKNSIYKILKEGTRKNNNFYADGVDPTPVFHRLAIRIGDEVPFMDVENGEVGAKEIAKAAEMGITSGSIDKETGLMKFNPTRFVRRDQFAIMLFNLAKYQGKVPADYKPTSTKLKDITKNSTGYDAIVWADENGIVTGYSNGNFKPANNITRAQITLMLMRYAQKYGFDTSARDESILTYADADNIQKAFVSSVEWASAEGIMSGITKNGQKMVNPNGYAIRTQCAIFMIKYSDNVELLPE